MCSKRLLHHRWRKLAFLTVNAPILRSLRDSCQTVSGRSESIVTKRQDVRAQRPVHRETFITPWPEAGLIALGSPADPQPSLRICNGTIVEMDGKRVEEFDLIDRFVAAHSIDLASAEIAMATPSREIARMLVDINVT